MNVTRNVIADLWTLSVAGEASDDSRRLIEEYLKQDPDFARSLRENGGALPAVDAVELPPDLEAKTLDRTKRRLRRRSPLFILALAFTGLAFARIIEDTTFTASPRRFVATAVVAAICWALYGWHTRRLRFAGLRGPAKR